VSTTNEPHRYIITWHVAVVRIGARGRNFISLGICEHTQRTAFIAIFNPDNAATQEALKTLIVKDVYAGTNGCEDGHYCLDLKCSLNKTTAKTFKEYKEVDTDKKLQGLSRHIEEFRSQLGLHTGEEGVAVYYEKPALIIKRKW
jgi:hypothetical protein